MENLTRQIVKTAHDKFKKGEFEDALTLYNEAEDKFGKGLFTFNIQRCERAISDTINVKTNTTLPAELKIQNCAIEDYVRKGITILDNSLCGVLLITAKSKSALTESKTLESIDFSEYKKIKKILLLDEIDFENSHELAESIGFDEIYFKPFRGSELFWTNFVLNCAEFTDVLVINASELIGSTRIKKATIKKQELISEFAFVNSTPCSFRLSSKIIKELLGFFLPLSKKFSYLNFFKRMQQSGLIKSEHYTALKKCIDFPETDDLAVESIEKITESLCCAGNQLAFVKAIDDIEKYKRLPERVLGEGASVVEFYDPDKALKERVDVFCFDSYLKRAGINGKIKYEDFWFLDGLENKNIIVLDNFETINKNHCKSAFFSDDYLYYYDLLPLTNYQIVDLEGLKAEGRIPLPVQMPVLCRLNREKYSLSNDLESVGKSNFGMISACYNNGKTVIASLLSVLAQSVKNLEINIVDDNSTDDSLDLISGFVNLFPYTKINIVSKEENIGVYACRNTAILKSSSEFLFGQDLDDHSTPQRVFISNLVLKSLDCDLITSNHSRMDSKFNLLSMKKGEEVLKIFRKGLMTWHTKRSNFFQYGMFLSVRKSGDSEFYDRIKRLSSKKTHDLNANLYFALMDDANAGRLTSDIFKVGVEESPVVYRFEGSNERFSFESNYKEIHKKQGLEFNYRFSRTIEDKNIPIIANMATIPGREDQLEQALNSILFQVDRLNLFFNGDVNSKSGNLQNILTNKKITLLKSDEIGDLRDNAKFYFSKYDIGTCYYLTLDDDLVYPEDYVDMLIYKSNLYDNKKIICIHGYQLWDNLKSIHTDSQKRGRYYHYKEELKHDIKVDVPGTGTVLIPPGVKFPSFKEPPYGMIDILFAEYCSKSGIDIISVSRTKEWLKEGDKEEVHSEKKLSTLYVENQKQDRESIILGYIANMSNRKNSFKQETILRVAHNHSVLKMHYNDRADCFNLPGLERKVYVCCTGYNYQGYALKFARSLWNALRNTNYSNVEILVYDDCSEDRSLEILSDYFSKNLTAWRYDIFTGKINYGPAYGRSFLFEKIKENDAICIFLDSDDEVEPQILRRIITEYQKNPDIIGTFGGWKFNDTVKKTWPSHSQKELSDPNTLDGKFKFGHPRSFVRSVYNSANKKLLFAPDGTWLRYCSDLGLLLAIFAKAESENMHRIDELLYRYNLGTSNGTIKRFGSNKGLMRDYLYSFSKLV